MHIFNPLSWSGHFWDKFGKWKKMVFKKKKKKKKKKPKRYVYNFSPMKPVPLDYNIRCITAIQYLRLQYNKLIHIVIFQMRLFFCPKKKQTFCHFFSKTSRRIHIKKFTD